MPRCCACRLPLQWIHVGHYAMGDETPVPMKQHTQRVGNLLGCEDSDQSCEQWAANGEACARAAAAGSPASGHAWNPMPARALPAPLPECARRGSLPCGAGECENNRTFMVGTSDSPGACVKVRAGGAPSGALPGRHVQQPLGHVATALLPPTLQACDACLEVYSAAEKPHGTE